MKRQLREEMNELSKQVFGTSSRWKKIVDYGSVDSYEEDNIKVVPNKLTGQLEQLNFKKRVNFVRHYTLEQVKELMESILVKRSEQLALVQTEPTNEAK